MRQFLVLRGAINPAEHKVLAEKIHAEFRAGVYDDYGGNFEKGIHYPNPKVRYDHGSLLLEKDPHRYRITCGTFTSGIDIFTVKSFEQHCSSHLMLRKFLWKIEGMS